MPTFRIDNRLDLEPVLRALGLTKLFNTQANLTGITEEAGLYLNAAIHKNSIRIGENGVDGSVANSLKSVDLPHSGKSPYLFIADRPFIFVIWDQKTDSIISVGRLTLP